MGLGATNEAIGDGRAASGDWGLDTGAVSTRNTSKGALVAEAHAVWGSGREFELSRLLTIR